MDSPHRGTLQRVQLDGDRVSQIEQFFTVKECKEWIARAEQAGFKKSVASGGGHGRTGREEARDNHYTVVVDQDLADKLWNRVKSHIPQTLEWMSSSPYFGSAGGAEWRACGLVERFRCYKYHVSEHYPEHMDGCYKRTVTTQSGDTLQQQSFLTLLTYLNDDFEGGETKFYPDRQHCRFLKEQENRTPTIVVTPKAGAALISDHTLLHEGAAVTAGIKYVVRTDILYQRTIPTHPKLAKFATTTTATTSSSSSSSYAFVSEWEKIFEPSCKAYHD